MDPRRLFALCLACLWSFAAAAGNAFPIFNDGFEGEYFPPELQAIPDQTVTLGDTWRLRAVGSSEQPNAVLSFAFVQAPAGAEIIDASVGVLRWTPTATGRFDFILQLSDRTFGSDTASFAVDVLPTGNRPPYFVDLADRRIPVLVPFALTVQVADDDPGDAVALSLIDGPAGLGLVGSQLQWTPGLTQLGPHTVKLQASDKAGALAVNSFAITVDSNQPPLARDDFYEVTVGETLAVPASFGVLVNDADPEGAPLTAQAIGVPDLGKLLNFAPDGGFTYQAPASDPWPGLGLEIVWEAPVADPTQGYYLYGPPLAADLNGDGKPDLVFSHFNQGQTALSGADGSVLWDIDRGSHPAGVCSDWLAGGGARVLADIDDDGKIEFVYPTACYGDDGGSDSLLVLDNEGKIKWLSPRLSKPHPDSVDTSGDPRPYFAGLGFTASLGTARLTPDAKPVLLLRRLLDPLFSSYWDGESIRYVGCRVATGLEEDENEGCRVTLLIDGGGTDGTPGEVLHVLRAPNPGNLDRAGVGNDFPARNLAPLAVDLDGDGVLEIVSGSDVWKQDGDGQWSLAWQTDEEPVTLGVADLDGDGQAEVVHVRAALSPMTRNGIFIYRHDGSLLRRIPYYGFRLNYLSIADVDGDGVPELLVAADGRIEAFRPDGRIAWTRMLPEFDPPPDSPPLNPIPYYERMLYSSLSVYDLDGDGVFEVIYGSRRGFGILDGRNGQQLATVFQYSPIAHPMVLDVDDDGQAEIVALTEGGWCNAPGHTIPSRYCVPLALRGTNRPWLPGPKIRSQIEYQPTAFADDGTVLHDTTVPTSFRVPIQLGTADDPAQRRRTHFDYPASDGGQLSDPARVEIEIQPENLPPVFTSRPPRVLPFVPPQDAPTYTLSAYDPEGGPVEFRPAEPLPFGVSLDTGSGVLSFNTLAYGDGNAMFVAVEAVDVLGAATVQAFYMDITNDTVAIPDVLGQPLATALQTLEAVQLYGVETAALYDSSPAGSVIGQAPEAGDPDALAGSEVWLTVSLGPAPVVVPNVVGLGETSASGQLSALGFALQPPLRVFDEHVPRGEVLAQEPPAMSEVVPDTARLTVSAGNGIELRLSREVSPSNQPIDIDLRVTDVDGNPLPPPPVEWTVIPSDPRFLPLPTVVGDQLLFDPATRGAFTLTATDTGSGRSASARFGVFHPQPAGTTTNAGEFAEYSEALNALFDLRETLIAARDSGDENAMRAVLAQMVAVWQAQEIVVFYGAAPVSPENGFPLSLAELPPSIQPTPDDVLFLTVLRDASRDAKALLDAWENPNTSVEELSELDLIFQLNSRRIGGIPPTVYGLIGGIPDYQALLATRLPRILDQMFTEVDQLLAAPRGKSMTLRGKSTLPEQLTVVAVNKVVETLSEPYQRFKKEAFGYAAWTTAVVAIENLVRNELGAGSAEAVVSGTSLSIRVFEAPYSMIEGIGYEATDFDLNEVLLVGPDLPESILSAVQSFLQGYNQIQQYQNFDELRANYKPIKKIMKERFEDPVQEVVRQAKNMYQPPQDAERPCLFASGPACTQLLYPDGFRSVYSLPANAYVALPRPIPILVLNPVNGAVTFDLVPFLPTVREN